MHSVPPSHLNLLFIITHITKDNHFTEDVYQFSFAGLLVLLKLEELLLSAPGAAENGLERLLNS